MLRDGVQRLVPAAEVVVGDLLVLAEGDIVPGRRDRGRVRRAAGRRGGADRGVGAGGQGRRRPTRNGPATLLSAGTVVVRGRGRAVVTATGTASAMGRVAALMATGPALTPLQRRLVGVGRVLAGVAVALCAVVLALGLVRGQPVELMVVTAISLVVAAVPESLPAVVTLGPGAGRPADGRPARADPPAARGGDPRLGDRARHRQDRHPHRGHDVRGGGCGPRTGTPRSTAPATPRPAGSARATGSHAGRRTGRDRPAHRGGAVQRRGAAPRRATAGDRRPWTAVGDPTEAALLAAGGKFGLDQADLTAALPRAAELPFDSDRKRMTTVAPPPGRPGPDRLQGRPGSRAGSPPS